MASFRRIEKLTYQQCSLFRTVLYLILNLPGITAANALLLACFGCQSGPGKGCANIDQSLGSSISLRRFHCGDTRGSPPDPGPLRLWGLCEVRHLARSRLQEPLALAPFLGGETSGASVQDRWGHITLACAHLVLTLV